MVKNVLHCPECTKSLLSVVRLGQQGNQVVFPAEGEWFAPGIYRKKRRDNDTPRCIPLQVVNGLCYVPTRTDFLSKDGFLTSIGNTYVNAH